MNNEVLKLKVLEKYLVSDFQNNKQEVLSNYCLLDNGVKIKNVDLPYLDVKSLRGQNDPIIKTEGIKINKGDFAILVDGENSGEVFQMPCEGYLGSTLKKLTFLNGVNDIYVRYFIDLNKDLLKNSKTGAAIPHLNKKLFANLTMHVPSIDIQNEIVKKIENFFNLIDKKEKNDQEKNKLKDILKEKILDSAIQGNLVNTSSDDVNDLIEKIIIQRKEYSLKESNDKINNSAMSFNIPENWKFVELYKLYNFIDYRGMTPTKIDSGIPLITATNIKNGYLDFTKKDFISFDDYESRKTRGITNKNDILFTTEAPLGNCAINNLELCSTGQRIITLQNYGDIRLCNKLFMYFINSKSFQQQLKDNATGVTATGIKASKLKKLLIPVPPLEEQYKIVEKIEQCFELIEQL